MAKPPGDDPAGEVQLLDRAWAPSPAAAAAAGEQDGASGEPAADPTVLTVLSFNVLADGLAQQGNFVRADKALLEWAPRFPLLWAEVRRVDPDIGGLAEFNMAATWRQAFEQGGYESIAAPKSKSPAARLGSEADGCCLFWRRARFECLLSRVYGADPVQAVAVLLDKARDGRAVVVSMTHLKAKKPHAHTREAQGAAVAERVRAVAADSGREAAPLLVCGDFNADWDEPCVQNMLSSLGLTSAYGPAGQPAWTTWKYRGPSAMGRGGEQKHTIDYILHGPGLEAISTLGLPADDGVRALGLPRSDYGSDHLAIAAKLRFTAADAEPVDT